VDDIVCAATPEPFYAVALWYAGFPQTTDQEVRELLETAAGCDSIFVDRPVKLKPDLGLC